MKHKGFTLIELLVVIAIIGILAGIIVASTGTARLSARDSRRVADLHEVQLALEMYYNASSAYPSDGDGSSATGSWTTMMGAIVPTYLNATISDPKNSGDYLYGYCETGTAVYVLRACLETDHDALDNDWGDNVSWDPTCECNDEGGPAPYEYCVHSP